MITRASSSESKRHALSSSSRSRPLNDSIQAFCHGEPGIDEQRSGAVESAPVVDGVGDELGPVVETHVGRGAPLQGELIQDGDDAVGVDAAIHVDRQGFAGELVDDVEHLQGAAIGGGVELKVHRPDDVRADR